MDSGEEWRVLDETYSDVEEVLVVPATKSRGGKTRPCPICPMREVHSKRHVYKDHFPFYMAPESACWFCGQQEAQRGRVCRAHIDMHQSSEPLFNDFKLDLWVRLIRGVFQFLCSEYGKTTEG